MEIRITYIVLCKCRGKAIPLQPWTGPELVYGSTEAENGHFFDYVILI